MKPYTSWKSCLFGILLNISLFSIVDSLRCYQCDSGSDIRCSEELFTRDLRPLPCEPLSEARFCVKTTGIFGAECLNCYQCNSNNEYSCGEFFNRETTSAELSRCKLMEARYCIKATGIFDGQLGTKRFCSERDLDNQCTFVRRPGDQREYRSCVYTCQGDGCNGSTSLNPLGWINVMTIMFLICSSLTIYRH